MLVVGEHEAVFEGEMSKMVVATLECVRRPTISCFLVASRCRQYHYILKRRARRLERGRQFTRVGGAFVVALVASVLAAGTAEVVAHTLHEKIAVVDERIDNSVGQVAAEQLNACRQPECPRRGEHGVGTYRDVETRRVGLGAWVGLVTEASYSQSSSHTTFYLRVETVRECCAHGEGFNVAIAGHRVGEHKWIVRVEKKC